MSATGGAHYQAIAAEALGLGSPYSDSDDSGDGHLNIGRLSLIDSDAAVDAVVAARVQQVMAIFDQGADVFSVDDKQSVLDRMLLNYELYLDASKMIERLAREAAEMESNEHALRYIERLPGYSDYRHIKKIEAELGPIRGGRGTELDLFKRQIESRLNGINPDKLARDLVKRSFILNRLYPDDYVELATRKNFRQFTADREGYLRYLWDSEPKLVRLMQAPIEARLSEEDRKRHTYVVGGTGSGKSELLKLLVHCYVARPDYGAVVVMDPHGDLTEQISKWKEFQTGDRLVYVDPYLIKGSIPTLNPLETGDASAEEREVMAQQLAGAFEELLRGSGGTGLTLNMRTLLLPCILVLMDQGNATLTDLQTFLNDEHNDRLVGLGKASKRPAIRRFFEREFHDRNFSVTKQSVRTKLQSLFNSSVFYETVNGKTTVDLKAAIEQKKVILFNLAKGRIGPEASEALGRFVIAMLQGLALRRQSLAPEERVPVHLFIDECQNYIGNSTITILEEARKYRLHLTLAQQLAGRGMSPEMRAVVLNNTNVKLAGRTAEDERMAKLLGLPLSDLQTLPVGGFFCRSGANPVFKLQADTRVLGDTHAMTPAAWTKTLKRLERAYRPFDGPEKPGEGSTTVLEDDLL